MLSAGVRQVFTRRGLEKNPTLDVKLALEDRPGSGYGVHRPGLSEEEASRVAGLLGRVRSFAATEGLIVKVQQRLVENVSGRVCDSFNTRHPVRCTTGYCVKRVRRVILPVEPPPFC